MTLLTVARYEAITGDETAENPTAAIAEAVELLEDYLDRPLELAERTETLRPDRRGRLWPRATPITDGGDYEIDGLALVGASPFGPALGFVDPATSLSVTYTGGWTASTLPACIGRDLAWAAYRLSHPPDLAAATAYPEGATSVRLGDAAVTFGPGGAGAVGTGDTTGWWSKRTRAYRYAPIHTGPSGVLA